MNHKIAVYIEQRRNDKDSNLIEDDSDTIGKADLIGQNHQLDMLKASNDIHLFDDSNSWKVIVMLSFIFNMGFVLYLISGIFK